MTHAFYSDAAEKILRTDLSPGEQAAVESARRLTRRTRTRSVHAACPMPIPGPRRGRSSYCPRRPVAGGSP